MTPAVNQRTLSGSAAIAAMVALSLSACGHFEGGSTTAPVAARGLPSEDMVDRAPLGQVAGSPASTVPVLSTPNPFQDNPQAIKQGRELYIKMNCAGCHAYNGKGNMGPDLTDTYWRYGGLPVQIYMTIRDGRPKGMPAWGVALPPDDIWKLVAYVQSLGGSVSVNDFKHVRQGDQPGEQIAPEAQADAQVDSPPPVPVLPNPAPVRPSEPVPSKGQTPVPPRKNGKPPL